LRTYSEFVFHRNRCTISKVLTTRDGTLMLIECAPQMFESLAHQLQQSSSINDDDDDDDAQLTTGFQLVIRACQRFYQSKIISNDKDLSGIILYGTENSLNAFDFKHIYILHELSQPSAERIIQLETLSERQTYRTKYNELFGSTQAKGYSLNEALWTCSNLFSNSPQRLSIKRIFIFTCNDQPHAANLTLERQAKQRAKDLNDVGIQLEVFPILTQTLPKFDYKKFFQDVLMLSDDDLEQRNNQESTGRLNELLKLVYSKEHKKRAYCTVPFSLGTSTNGAPLQLSVSVYNLVGYSTRLMSIAKVIFIEINIRVDDNTCKQCQG
jgi:ATP-dependent DNA helicase 2 subunit 1